MCFVNIGVCQYNEAKFFRAAVLMERAADIKSCPQVRLRRSTEDVPELVWIPNIFNSERTTDREKRKERNRGKKRVGRDRKRERGEMERHF